MVMPDVVGLADIDAASDAIEAACGSGTIFPEPAWDPSNPTPDEQIIHQIPAAGTPLVTNGFCSPAEGEFAGLSIAVFYTNPTYCSGPEDSIGLGWCPRQSPSTESAEPVPAASVTTPAPVATQAPPTTSLPPSNDLAMVMPNLIGLPNFDAVGPALIAACGSSVFFPEPGWDPANPVQSGQVIHQLPAPGTPLILNDTNPGFAFCTTSDGPYAGSALNAFGADPIYCAGPEDTIGFGWCPVQSANPTTPAATTSTTATPDS